MTTYRISIINFKIKGIIGLLSLFATSCIQHHDYNATTSCNNFEFFASTIFINEKIVVKCNKDVILCKTITHWPEGYLFKRYFCLPKTKSCSISVVSYYKSKKYIDTSFVFNNTDTNYHLIISKPHPLNWREYYKNGFPTKNWGHLSID